MYLDPRRRFASMQQSDTRTQLDQLPSKENKPPSLIQSNSSTVSPPFFNSLAPSTFITFSCRPLTKQWLSFPILAHNGTSLRLPTNQSGRSNSNRPQEKQRHNREREDPLQSNDDSEELGDTKSYSSSASPHHRIHCNGEGNSPAESALSANPTAQSLNTTM